MNRENLGDLLAFAAVAQHNSFTLAARQLGTSQSALSHTVRRLEEQLGVRLLARTTRSVATTEAGERLLETLRPALANIAAGIDMLGQFRDRPSGNVRITCSRHAADTVLWPAVEAVMARHPDVHIELSIDGAFTNIVTDRFDAGVRLGEQVEKDMIALRIGPDLRMRAVASPGYFRRNPPPASPRDLLDHDCINLRMATRGDLYVWEFEKDGHPLNVRVSGRLIVNDPAIAIDAALAGHGISYVLGDVADSHVQAGRLVPVLEDWCPPFPGHHLYYPDRRNPSPAFQVLLDELKARTPRQRG